MGKELGMCVWLLWKQGRSCSKTRVIKCNGGFQISKPGCMYFKWSGHDLPETQRFPCFFYRRCQRHDAFKVQGLVSLIIMCLLLLSNPPIHFQGFDFSVTSSYYFLFTFLFNVIARGMQSSHVTWITNLTTELGKIKKDSTWTLTAVTCDFIWTSWYLPFSLVCYLKSVRRVGSFPLISCVR